MIRRIAVLCNTASVQWKGSEVKETGDPLETGLLVFAHQTGLSIDDLRQASPKLREEPFSSETKIMATLHQTESGYFIFAKGSMEELLACCVSLLTPSGVQPLTDALRTEWLRKAEDLAAGGLRVLAGAYRPASPEESLLSNHLVFAGLIGMNDPPRPEVYQAIRECQSAGINLIMITGDHPFTARNIAQQLGIIPDTKSEVILGRDMQDYEHLSPAEKSRWAHSQVFARVSPQQKLDLVRVLQERRCVVGMTGDGVNDAPALKKADIGIAMGLRGTQVAQEVADMVLKDDSFSSIVLAIRQGRVIFENIRKFVIFLLSCNLSELLVIAIASMLNLHFQLFPLQILFINLITDVLPALALGVTEGGPDVMQQPPRAASEAIIDRQRWIAILFYSSVIGLASLGAVAISHYILHQSESWNAALCNNVLFYSLIFSQLLHVFNMGSGKSSFYRNEVFRNRFVWIALLTCGLILFGLYFLPPVRQVLSIHAMTGRDWLVSAGAGCFTLLFIQAAKRLQLIRQ